jgi:hypothetical protein
VSVRVQRIKDTLFLYFVVSKIGTYNMDPGRNMISSAVPFRAAGEGGAQVFLFGGGGGFLRGQ